MTDVQRSPIAPPGLDTDVRMRMEFRASPAVLLLSELLPLPAIELLARVDIELAANPALERTEPPSCPGCGHPVWREPCMCYFDDGRPERAELVSSLPARTSARDLLLRDVADALSAVERRIAAHLVADVDDYGVLDEPLPAVAVRLGVTEDDVRSVVAALRRAGSPGLCANSLADALRLQAMAAAPVPADVHVLLAAKPDTLVTDPKAIGLSETGLRTALQWLHARVVPEVFASTAAVAEPHVDVIVRRSAGRLLTMVVPGPWSSLRVADSYLAAGATVQNSVVNASRFVEALSRRERSLQRVADVVVAHQATRVRKGPRAHRHLTRRAVAAELGMHESTVSRVVAGKDVALPSGETVALATMFGAGREALHCLRDLVGDGAAGLPDAGLAAALAKRGHPVARRTIAKYRAELGIPAATRRSR